jgi:hypothetical protein
MQYETEKWYFNTHRWNLPQKSLRNEISEIFLDLIHFQYFRSFEET